MMEGMPYFFEEDQDEYVLGNKSYFDYFNMYSELDFEMTLAHLQKLDETQVESYSQTNEGWQIEVTFGGCRFLLDTHYHGTATLFCAEKSVWDPNLMLAFLGCFLVLYRADFMEVTLRVEPEKKPSGGWLRRLLPLFGLPSR